MSKWGAFWDRFDMWTEQTGAFEWFVGMLILIMFVTWIVRKIAKKSRLRFKGLGTKMHQVKDAVFWILVLFAAVVYSAVFFTGIFTVIQWAVK